MPEQIIRKELFARALGGSMPIDALRQLFRAEKGIIADSVSLADGRLFVLAEPGNELVLIVASLKQRALEGFSGDILTVGECKVPFYTALCPLTHTNAVRLRETLPRTAPSVLDCRESFGTGDRIGGSAPATSGHIAALDGTGMIPVLAQQSVRENHKTGRTYEQVMDDVTWSVFRTGYDRPWGSDADHQKELDGLDEAVRAGFTLFTLDPSEMIDNAAVTDSERVLGDKLRALFASERDVDAFISRYEGSGGADSTAIVRSTVKYLRAIRHAVQAYQRIAGLRGGLGFNFELSIDETATMTTALDHRIIVTECLREGVELFSLAPRFEGAFEKGIDYKGSVDGFRRSLTTHVALSRELGEYRLSLHSGSDKFSIYPVFGEETDGFFHIKTAGTSYLEAIKVVAATDMDFFRRILRLSLDTFEENAKNYEISANPGNVPAPSALDSDSAIREIEGNPDTRQVLHIAFGVILKEMGGELRTLLRGKGTLYKEYLVKHIGRHIKGLRGEM